MNYPYGLIMLFSMFQMAISLVVVWAKWRRGDDDDFIVFAMLILISSVASLLFLTAHHNGV